MTITIVIASFRYGHLAGQAIDSVLGQTRKPDRILFVDDGAMDCHNLTSIYGDYVEFILRPDNLGIVKNFNDMLGRVESEFVLFLGADNYLRPDALAWLMQTQEATGADIVSSDIALCGTQAQRFADAVGACGTWNGYLPWRFAATGNLEANNHIHGSSLYRVDLARQVGGYEQRPGGARTEEDWQLWRKMIAAGAKHTHVPEPLLYYRRHRENWNQ